MKTEKIAKKALKKVRAAVGKDLKDKQLEAIETILSDLAVEVANDMAKHCSKEAAKLCGPRTDLASDIADEIKRQKTALITNLQSLR
jgi:hypothetical protein